MINNDCIKFYICYMYVLSRFFEVYMYIVYVYVVNLQYKKICIFIYIIYG